MATQVWIDDAGDRHDEEEAALRGDIAFWKNMFRDEEEKCRRIRADLNKFTNILIPADWEGIYPKPAAWATKDTPRPYMLKFRARGSIEGLTETEAQFIYQCYELLTHEPHKVKSLSFEEFQGSKQKVEDLGAALRETTLAGLPGLLYLSALYIEDTHADAWTGKPYDHRYLTRLGKEEINNDNLEEIEKVLYQYAIEQGMCHRAS